MDKRAEVFGKRGSCSALSIFGGTVSFLVLLFVLLLVAELGFMVGWNKRAQELHVLVEMDSERICECGSLDGDCICDH